MNKVKIQHQESGFVILFAVIIAAIIFALGAGLFSSAQKETLLASTASESQIALGATDTGAECALYYAFINNGTNFSCAGNTVMQTGVACGTGTCFAYDMRNIDSDSSACGVLSITNNIQRTINGSQVSGTEIQVRGFNVCTNQSTGLVSGILSPDIYDPLLIERKFVIWYADAAPVIPPGGGGGPVGQGGGNNSTI